MAVWTGKETGRKAFPAAKRISDSELLELVRESGHLTHQQYTELNAQFRRQREALLASRNANGFNEHEVISAQFAEHYMLGLGYVKELSHCCNFIPKMTEFRADHHTAQVARAWIEPFREHGQKTQTRTRRYREVIAFPGPCAHLYRRPHQCAQVRQCSLLESRIILRFLGNVQPGVSPRVARQA